MIFLIDFIDLVFAHLYDLRAYLPIPAFLSTFVQILFLH